MAFFLCGTAFASSVSVEVRPVQMPQVIPRNAVRFPLMRLRISAEDAGQAISKIVLRREGLSSWTDIDHVWAQTANYRRTLRTKFQSDDCVRLRFLSPVEILPGEPEEITVFANFNFSGGGATARFVFESLELETVTPTEKQPAWRSWRNFRGFSRRSF
ncbi:MAG: hypothetical protein K9M51_03595 [Candidatus Gracilibacteria bacterium]|nr:hypothetical protein [Candidatus Gracilibacteria bacterium]